MDGPRSRCTQAPRAFCWYTTSAKTRSGFRPTMAWTDIPLVIQDRQFHEGRLVLPTGMMALMQGRCGDTLLVNGTADAELRVPAKWIRLRLVNGSNARFYELSFDDGRLFQWIASEGRLLGAPVTLNALSLAPGERTEILVDFSDGKPAMLLPGIGGNRPMMMGGIGRSGEDPGERQDPLLSLVPAGPPAQSMVLPAQLSSRRPPDAPRGVLRRRISLDMPMGPMMGGGMGGMPGAGSGSGAGRFAINGRAFDMARVDQRVRLGDAEIWEVSGNMMAHPFHMHGVHFEVLSRGGSVPSLRDQGLRDTVVVREPVELLVRFDQPAGGAPFMYHCHILEHEDNGMMGQYETFA